MDARNLLELDTEFKNIKLIYKQCSVTEESQLRKCMNEIKNELVSVDIIVNSAGILDESNWKGTIDINYVCRNNSIYFLVIKLKK